MLRRKLLRSSFVALAALAVSAAAVGCDDPDTPDNPEQPTTYSIVYVIGDGATGTPPAGGSYTAGATFSLATADGLNKVDHTFGGWSDGTTVYQAGATYTMPSANVTFTAQWTANDPDGPDEPDDPEIYTVTYAIGEGATGTAPAGGSYEEGDTFALAAADGLSKVDHTFGGWSDGTTVYQAGATYTMPSANVTFTAQWTANDPDDPEEPDSPIFTTAVNAVIAHDSDKTEGEMILSPDGSGYVRISNKSSGIAFIDNNFTYTVSADGTFTITSIPDSRITVPVSGTIDGNSVGITLENSSATGAKLTYVFQSDVYELSVDLNKPSSSPVIGYYPQDYAVDLTAFEDSYPGHTLVGFTVNGEDKTFAQGREFEMPAQNSTVVCVWQEIVQVNYTVTYTAGEGVGEDYVDTATTASYRLKYNTVTGFTRDGYRFAGWVVDGQDKSTGDTITLSGDTTVTARWIKAYNVAYANVDMSGVDTNFDPADTSKTEYTANTYYLPYETLPMFVSGVYFSRAGYTLRGWTSSADTDTDKAGTIYEPGSKYVLSQNTTFTAVWEVPSTLLADNAGEYVNSEGLTASGVNYVKVKVTADAISLTDDEGDVTSVSGIRINGDTASGKVGLYDVECAFGSGNITVTFKLGNNTYSAEFTPYVAPPATLDEYFGYWEGEASFNNYDYVVVRVSDNTISFSEDYYFGYQDAYEVTATEVDGKVTAVFEYRKTIFGTTTVYKGTLVFDSATRFTIKVEKMNNSGGVASVVLAPTAFTKSQAHTVTYSLGSYTGEATAPEAQTVIGSHTVTAPTAPDYEGYKFLGWFDGNSQTAFDFGSAITRDVALTAKWEQITEVTVTFNVGSGVTGITPPTAQTVPYDSIVSDPGSLQRDGYRFDGWYISLTSATPFDFTTKLKKDTTLTAKWSKEYTVTFRKPNGAVGDDPAQITICSGDTLTYPECPYTKEGVSFLGWKNHNSTKLYAPGDRFKYTFQMNATVTAVFGTVYTNIDDGAITVRDDNAEQVWYYTGDGDYDYNEFVDCDIDPADNSIIFLYLGLSGVWVQLNNDSTYTVLDALYGINFTATDGTQLIVDGKGNATLGTASATYTVKLNGYGTADGFILDFGSGNTYDITFEVFDDNYMPILNTDITVGGTTYTFGTKCTVTYSLGDGVVGDTPSAVTVWKDSSITLDDGNGLSKDGYTFAGWQVNGAGAKLNGNYKVAADVTLVAAWTENGGDVGGGSTLKDYKAIYGYSSFAEASSASANKYLSITTSLGEYQIWQVELITKSSGGTLCYQMSFEYCVDGKAKTKNAGMILYKSGTSSSDKLTDDNESVVSVSFEFKVSGNAVTVQFGEQDGVKTITLTNGASSVTWTVNA